MNPSALKKLNAYASCIKARALQGFLLTWATIIGLLITSKGVPPLIPALKGVTATFAIAIGVYIFNDVMDYRIDKINQVDRPIAQEKVSKKEAMSLVLLFFIVGVALSLSINIETFLLCTTFLTLGILYSLPYVHLKKRFLAKQTVPAIGGAISNIIGGAAIGTIPLSLLYAGFLFFLLCFAGSPLGDLADIKGDKEQGRKTLAIVYGPIFPIKLAIIILLCIAVMTALTYSSFGFNLFAPILITIACLFFSWTAFSLMTKWQNPKYCISTYKKMGLALFIFEIALFIGIL